MLETRHALSLHGCYPIVLILKMFSHAGAIRLLRFGFSKNVWFLTRSGKPLEPDLNTVNAIHLEQRLNFAIKHVVCNFITAAKQALGNNLKLMIDNVYAIYSGDANQDGIVDGGDMSAIDNANVAIQTGYYPEDINGDGLVDASDMALIDNNSIAVVHVRRP